MGVCVCGCVCLRNVSGGIFVRSALVALLFVKAAHTLPVADALESRGVPTLSPYFALLSWACTQVAYSIGSLRTRG